MLVRLAPSAQIFRHSVQIGYILVIFFASAESPPRSSVSGLDLYISDMPDLIPRSIESAALGRCGCRRARGRQDQWGRHARSLPGCCYWV